MTLLVCWVIFPLALAGLSLGCGLAVARLSKTRVPATLIVPLGFAAIVVLALFASLLEATAPVFGPAVLALAAVGLAWSVSGRIPRPDGWAFAAPVLTFLAFAAPIVLSGTATFAGYIKLDDTSTFLAITDRAIEHGRSLEGLNPSSYEASLAVNLPFYPLGSLLPLGLGSGLSGQDGAWLYQPYLAFLAALLAAVLYQLAFLVTANRPFRVAAAALGAQAALLYGYALWGGVKELAAAPLVALVAALTGSLFARRARILAYVPLTVSAAALVGVLSVGAVAWLLPMLAVGTVTTLGRRDRHKALVLVGLLAASLLPSLVVARLVLGHGVLGSLRDPAELGNLIAPLSPLQVVGIWPVGDFRVRPDDMAITYVLLALTAAAAFFGLVIAGARRAWEILLYAGSALAGAALFAVAGSPWVEAKAFAIGSPAVVFAAVLGAAALVGRGRRTEGIVVVGIVALGVLWSNALAFREANLAPRQQLAELELIGERFADQGPALMTEYQPYGVRHFLRELDPEGASELRRRLVPLRDGSTLGKGAYADLDAFRLDGIVAYRTLVLRRSPLASRPPLPFQLVWSGHEYEVWQRPSANDPAIRAHVPVGVESCTSAVAQLARTGSSLAVAKRPRASVVALSTAARPPTWPADQDDPAIVYPQTEGSLDLDVDVAQGGTYDLWVGGSFRGQLEVTVDGRRVASLRHRLNYAGQFTSLARAELAAGRHRVRLRYRRPTLRPGTGGTAWGLGPFVLSPADAPRSVDVVDSQGASALCRQPLDWVELLS